ncbi:MAG: hypothetical protein WBA70_03525, partial [Thermodesulfobacteriota bacterium]
RGDNRMTTESTENLLIESKFETLISKSKLYIKTRNEEDLISLNEDIEDLKAKVSSSLENNASGHNINYLTSLKLMLSILDKFTSSVVLMGKMKSKKPLYEQFDTKQMLDILLPNIKCLIECENWSENLDTKKLENDYAFIEALEDQNKRVLLTYLIQDWHNMDEVLNLLKIGEIYKNIAEKLVSLSLLTNYLQKQN